MWLEFFEEYIVSLIFQGIKLFSISKTFFWSQLNIKLEYQAYYGPKK